MNRKVKSFTQTVFLLDQCVCQKLQQAFEVQSFGLDTGPQSFCYSFIALPILFKVSPEIRCSGDVSSRHALLLWKHTAGSKPI